MKPGSVPHYASGILVNFTPRLQLRGGVERIPGFMCSESRDAAKLLRVESLSISNSHLQSYSAVAEHLTM